MWDCGMVEGVWVFSISEDLWASLFFVQNLADDVEDLF